MSPEEKKLEKLNALFEMINEDYATPDDLIKLSEAILGIITTEKQRQTKELENTKGETAREITRVIAVLNEKERSLEQIITRLTYETEQAVAAVESKLSNELKRLERKIPTKTDLSGLERDIVDIKASFNTLPTELTINNEAIRDGLELLQDDERLDKSAIKGLDDWEEIAALARSPKTIGNAGVKLLRYLNDVNIEGITNGQTIVWNSTLSRFEAGSAGTGGGHTIENEGTPLTQRTNLNFVGANVNVTDDAGNDATVVTISGGGSGTVNTIVAGNNIDVDATDPANPIVSVETLTLADISDVTASVTEINYVDGVTSAIQTQLNGKAPSLGVDDNYVTDAEKAALHAAVTVTDSAEIDLTLAGQNITASIIAGSIDETKLDASTNASLDLADTASQPGHTHTAANITDFTEAAQDATGAMVATSIVYNDAGATLQRAALTGAITASQDSNATALGSFTKAQLDAAVSDGNVLYVGDVTTNATHTGEVTGATTLTVDKTAITNKTLVTAAAADKILIADASDTDNLKYVTAQAIADLATGGTVTNFNDIYIDQSGGTSDTYGAISGTINGSNAVFTVSQAAYATGTLQVWLNGQLMIQGTGSDWTETTPASGTFTFVVAPASGSELTVAYQKVVTNSDTVVTTTTVTELAQDAVGTILTDSAEIDFTYNDGAPSITAALVASSIDETKLDASVNASLDLADSSLQPAAIGTTVQGYSAVLAATTASFLIADETKLDGIEALADVTDATNVTAAGAFMKSVDDTDDITVGTTNKFATAAEKTKLGHITVTQAVDLDAIETASHAAVTVTDSSEINFTLTGQDITAALVASSIDETKLDASVNTSLDLADTAVQPGDLLTDLSGDLPFSQVEQIATNRILGRSTAGTGDIEALTAATARDILGVDTDDSPHFAGVNIGHATDTTVTRVSAGLIAVEGVNLLRVGDVTTNATHTGEVTGSGALTVDKTAITGKTEVTAVGTDYVLISDTSDTGNLKKALVSDLTGAGSTSVARSSRFGWVFPDNTINAATDIAAETWHTLSAMWYELDTAGNLVKRDTSGYGTNFYYTAANAVLVRENSVVSLVNVSSSDTTDINTLTSNSGKRSTAISTLITFCEDNNFDGVDLDMEDYGSWTLTHYNNFKTFVSELGLALHAKGLILSIEVPPIWNTAANTESGSGDAWDSADSQAYYELVYSDFNSLPVDQVVVMCYDYQYDYSAGEPNSPLKWMEEILEFARDNFNENKIKIIAGIPAAGYSGATGGYSITGRTYDYLSIQTGFGGASRDSNSGELIWANGGISYAACDDTTIQTKVARAEQVGIFAYALWHIGDNQYGGDTLTNTIKQPLAYNDFAPSVTDGESLGTSTRQFSDLFLAEGGVINWDNGDATLTQAGDTLTLAGADLLVPDEAYGVGWDGSLEVPTKNALYDKLALDTMGTVVHGATAGTARPVGYPVVTWIGSVEPTNATNNDIWYETA